MIYAVKWKVLCSLNVFSKIENISLSVAVLRDSPGGSHGEIQHHPHSSLLFYQLSTDFEQEDGDEELV